MPYHVYILTNKNKTVLYIGFTGNLAQRIEQHKLRTADAFTKKYNATILIYVEEFQDVNEARARERAMKKWNREWKEKLINESNSNWDEILI